ncbi:MAG: hypothetical protein LBR72_07390 [Oscillospiraceae bacterium]|nr:hypothetical protein [Oscillospiraceae bacterium]
MEAAAFGDHVNDDGRLYALPESENTAFLPVFTSTELMVEHFSKVGRPEFVIMDVPFVSFLEVTSSINAGNTP